MSTIDSRLPLWKQTGPERFSATGDCGNRYLEAYVMRGGNGKWTHYILLMEKGRPKKRGQGNCKSTVIDSTPSMQQATLEEAKLVAEDQWQDFVSKFGLTAIQETDRPEDTPSVSTKEVLERSCRGLIKLVETVRPVLEGTLAAPLPDATLNDIDETLALAKFAVSMSEAEHG